MTLLDFLREYRQGGLLLVVLAVYSASWWVRKQRPDLEALKKLGFAIAGLAPLLFVIVFLAVHRSSELWGSADAMMIFAAIGVIERYHAVIDAWRELVKGRSARNETAERLAEARSGEPELMPVPPALPSRMTRVAPDDAAQVAAENAAAEAEAHTDEATRKR